MQKLKTIIFPIDVDGFLRFRGSMLGGKIDLGVSWRPLGASWRRLKASWRLLGASEGHLAGVLRRLRGVWRRFEASSRPPGGGASGRSTAGRGFGGVLRVL